MSTSTHSVTAKSRLHINNEDAYFIGNDFVVIADGMGGESNGEIASRIAVDTISTIINDSIKNLNLDCTKDYIENVSKLAVTKADTAISQYVDSNPDSIGMGTTILLAIYKNETLYITWCGDSHCYMFRTRVRDKDKSNNLNRQLEKVADSLGNIIDI